MIAEQAVDYGAIGLLLIAVGWLAKLLLDYLKRDTEKVKSFQVSEKQRLADCEEKHEKSQKQVNELTGNVKFLEGRMTTFESMTASAAIQRAKLQDSDDTLISKADEIIKRTDKIYDHILKG